MARHLLVKELSVAKNSNEDSIEEELHQILRKTFQKKAEAIIEGPEI